MASNYRQPGNVLTFTAPTGGVESGQGLIIGDLFVVAAVTAAATHMFEAHTFGVFELPKTTSQVWAEGVSIYWDSDTEKCTTEPSGNVLIGNVAAAAGSSATVGEVRLR